MPLFCWNSVTPTDVPPDDDDAGAREAGLADATAWGQQRTRTARLSLESATAPFTNHGQQGAARCPEGPSDHSDSHPSLATSKSSLGKDAKPGKVIVAGVIVARLDSLRS
jgi:hypothetical protein